MAQYKVLQDIEADEKFVGPLTLKQFIFACIAVVCGYVTFFFFTKGLWPLSLPFLAVFAVAGFLAFPWGKDQPTELWLLAKIQFYFKPKRRIWDQTGVQELVTITAPKKEEHIYTDSLSQTEVKSRLKALADTIDSRGWAIKNVNVNMFAQPGYMSGTQTSDRLIDPTSLSNDTSSVDIQASDDIMDEQNNPLAQSLNERIAASEASHRQAMLAKMKQVEQDTKKKPAENKDELRPDFWFMDQPAPGKVPAGYSTFTPQTSTQTPSATATTARDTPLSQEEKALLEKIHKEKSQLIPPSYGHMKVIMTPEQQKKAALEQAKKSAIHKPKAVTPTPDFDILNAAIDNNRDVASLAREMSEKHKQDEPDDDEVVISLH